MITLNEFHQNFIQTILSDSESRGLLKTQSFFENICEDLINTGELTTNYTAAEYNKKGIEIYGYDYDDERKILSLLVHQFNQEENIKTLTKNDIIVKFNRLKKYLEKCKEGLHEQMEETSEAYSMTYNIYQYLLDKNVDKIRLIILTDGKITRTIEELSLESFEKIPLEFRIIDINYLYKIYLSESSGGDFEIDLNLPCLKVDEVSEKYQSYLAVIPGNILTKIYEKHGQRLLEQNVRTFLQFKGNVNKGLKNTIEYKPEMFFAYNNGITATATEVIFNDKGNIIKIKNFQIVNGGQTTSAIYSASKKSKLDVSKVFIQMKLSVIKEKESQNELVSKISEYANTQNKVNKSDFFSNSPFHKEFKDYSKRIWIPAVNGSQNRTHWYYERVRGEYLNEQAYLTVTKKKSFQLENPKKQLIEKTFLSKSENAWGQKPYIVSKGAQYSFMTFAEQITTQLEKNNLAITEKYFKDSISRIILFKTVEKLISNATWYDGGYRAQTVAYTISYLSYIINKKEMYLNFQLIWEKQVTPFELLEVLRVIAEAIYKEITNPSEGHANVAQWCKKINCWERVKEITLNLEFKGDLLLNKNEEKYNKKIDKKEKKIWSGIEIQIFVINLPHKNWDELLNYFQKEGDALSSMQYDILKKMSNHKLLPPSEKQSKILYTLYEKALNEGFIISQDKN